jgi:thioredoxin
MLTLIDFWASWCQPCKKIAPILEKLAEEFQGQLELVKIDADDPGNDELLIKYDVKSIPTLILLNGDEVLSTLVGLKSEADLRAWIRLGLEAVKLEAK